MIRNHYVGRTFIQPTQSMRNFGVRVKINPVRAMIEGKKICIVDDSIVRGTTMITRVKKLRELGAKEVHIRISCPPVKYPCHYGIDFSSRGELIAAQCTLPEIVSRLDVDSLHYLSIDGLLRSVMHSDSYCLACFTGEYPVPCEECDKYRLEVPAAAARAWPTTRRRLTPSRRQDTGLHGRIRPSEEEDMSIARIKGFADMFPPQSDNFTRMENCARDIFGRYGFVELRTPLVEFTELFQRSIGEETDVVQKEMYTFPDRKGRSLTLRPEATAGVMRAYIESG